MGEIKININSLEDKIQELRSLQTEIGAHSITCPSVVGGGSSVKKLEKIATVYKTLNASLLHLVSNTVIFMEATKKHYEESDTKASNKISGK